QEWRELRLAESAAEPPGVSEGTGQSAVKVSLCEGEAPQQVPYCMALGYTKSMCAAAMTGAHLQGALPLDGDLPAMRALVIGLGAGSMPLWLQHTFPEGQMTVDALEIDPAVVKVATDAMGFPKDAIRDAASAQEAAKDAVSSEGGLRVYSIPGEDFVEALAATGDAFPGLCRYQYDMVFVDAFDKSGKVPPVLVEPEGTFLQSLSKVLKPDATIIMNLLVGMTGTGSSGGPKEIEAMVSAIHGTCCSDSSEVFTIRTPINESSGNQLYGFLRA
ncbi:EEF1AKNMT, partial [Symbiodinium sp. CCMP2456]